ncbi:hypothetical protein LINPERPRIM_LOCUS36443 [Linum perenne]
MLCLHQPPDLIYSSSATPCAVQIDRKTKKSKADDPLIETSDAKSKLVAKLFYLHRTPHLILSPSTALQAVKIDRNTKKESKSGEGKGKVADVLLVKPHQHPPASLLHQYRKLLVAVIPPPLILLASAARHYSSRSSTKHHRIGHHRLLINLFGEMH